MSNDEAHSSHCFDSSFEKKIPVWQHKGNPMLLCNCTVSKLKESKKLLGTNLKQW